ncbi:SDR family NAD(P)-dependent oxidoreductase [Bdellovibrio sp. NC01]|uniref:SDR family NAD(P)-dependent oxidoreductase n=1 Tax=Bdellovibrio sp. NC01 TaxID=2220073 RepID=UPI001159703F|nr:SDR family oxidoreductase [Bdellovibrio sp. NC01]QDK36662.1 short-chain dehydrogenase [Bdellovibrio sp. NC01]
MDAKIAVITGGSRGLGKNTSIALAKKGHDVILTYNSKKEEAEEVVRTIESLGRKAVALQLDVSSIKNFPAFAAQVAEVLKMKFNRERFDFLINNAGIGINAPLAEVTEEQFDTLVNIQLKSVVFLTQKMLPLLNDGGRIVNISTGLTRFTLPSYGVYAAMKGAIETLTKYMAKEFGARGISVNAVAPGAIETDFTKNSLGNPQVRQVIVSNTALGRAGQPDDIGGVIAGLLSEENRWITAQRIEASGGMFL